MAKERSFWSSIPGLLTGLAGVLTGVVGLLGLAANQGWLGEGKAEEGQGEGSGSEVVRISVEPDEVSLTKVPLRDAKETLTVSNDGTEPVTVSTSLEGEDAETFKVDDGDCTRSAIPSGGRCDMSVIFDAGPRPSPYRASLEVAANGDEQVQQVVLEGISLG